MMQLDMGGLLAALVSGSMPEAGMLAEGGRRLPADDFQRLLLERLDDVVASLQAGQDSGAADLPWQGSDLESWLQTVGIPVGAVDGGQAAFSARLDELRRYLSALAAATGEVPLATPGAVTDANLPPAGTDAKAPVAWPSRSDTDRETEETPPVVGLVPPETAVPDPGVGDAPVVVIPVMPPADDPGPQPAEARVSPADTGTVSTTTGKAMPAVPMPDAPGTGTAPGHPAPDEAGPPPLVPEPARADTGDHDGAVEPAEATPARAEAVSTPLRLPLDMPGQRPPPAAEGPPAPPVSVAMPQPVGRPEWGEALGERLLWMADQGVQVAELRLHPQHLGPVEVRIQVQDDQTTIQFSAQHAAVREALEAALPRLREAFAAQQLSLGQVEVGPEGWGGQDPSQARQDDAGERPRPQAWGGEGEAAEEHREEAGGETAARTGGTRLVSLYA